jgi:hypothetical protein
LRQGDIPHDPGILIFEVVEHVHIFLVGTVLYITAIGLYQLFVRPIDFHGWLRIESTDQALLNLEVERSRFLSADPGKKPTAKSDCAPRAGSARSIPTQSGAQPLTAEPAL